MISLLVRDWRRVVLLCALPAAVLGAAEAMAADFNDRGNILIADQFNNRVIEIDPHTHAILWQFGNGSDKAGPHSIVGTNDAERFGPLTLISGTGIPPASPPLPGCSDPVNGCPDNRVTMVSPAGHIVWQYAQADANNKRIVEVDAADAPVWEYLTNTEPHDAKVVWDFTGLTPPLSGE